MPNSVSEKVFPVNSDNANTNKPTKTSKTKAMKISGQAVRYRYVINAQSPTVLKKIVPDKNKLKAKVSHAIMPAVVGMKFQRVKKGKKNGYAQKNNMLSPNLRGNQRIKSRGQKFQII